jgi:hypothetical protein
MWAALLTAVLEWLAGLVRSQTRTVAGDAQGKPGLRERLNRRVEGWKAGRGTS